MKPAFTFPGLSIFGVSTALFLFLNATSQLAAGLGSGTRAYDPEALFSGDGLESTDVTERKVSAVNPAASYGAPSISELSTATADGSMVITFKVTNPYNTGYFSGFLIRFYCVDSANVPTQKHVVFSAAENAQEDRSRLADGEIDQFGVFETPIGPNQSIELSLPLNEPGGVTCDRASIRGAWLSDNPD